ncbi:nuclear transcription factor Y subunit A-9-like [Punica granatum]|uniref:Nuclear transcription factor Y subunit n=2 Tax=Punica granatum TaxID=22663 RepID=A0A2I0HJM9_PUNGR|nr:nuclear transcription factor Y subunit A-9-like [Punica granatum]PKI31904.1 hypothetical protein CRG98_047714 [Punica granatum]
MPGRSENIDQQLEQGRQIRFHPSGCSQPSWGNNISFTNGASKWTSMSEQLQMNSPMELVGHTVVLTSSLYSDRQYGGLLSSSGAGTMVPQLYGVQHARIPLPFEMEEEPVYVNPKQYHGILRRRQSRAKAELEQKVMKVRKPYLHESRHRHAMRRPRGSGGRFLNTKKLDSDGSPVSSEKGMNSTTNDNVGKKANVPPAKRGSPWDPQ